MRMEFFCSTWNLPQTRVLTSMKGTPINFNRVLQSSACFLDTLTCTIGTKTKMVHEILCPFLALPVSSGIVQPPLHLLILTNQQEFLAFIQKFKKINRTFFLSSCKLFLSFRPLLRSLFKFMRFEFRWLAIKHIPGQTTSTPSITSDPTNNHELWTCSCLLIWKAKTLENILRDVEWRKRKDHDHVNICTYILSL